MERVILHCDCNAFFASVECLLHPELQTVPMAVCGDPESRHGIILAKNEAAKKFGVATAETIWQAKNKCPALVLVPPHHSEYLIYSKRVNLIYQRFTNQVESFGIDESWLDVTGSFALFGDGETIATEIRRATREELGLTVSVGVSFNKAFAKLGSDYKKPDATTVISRENYKQLVWPLPVGALLYVGTAAQKTLAQLYIHTIGDLAQSSRALLCKKLGKMGGQIHDYACGLDESPVRTVDDIQAAKSIGNSMTYKRNLIGNEDIRHAVYPLCESVGARMRKQNVKCWTVQVGIRDPDFKSISRQCALPAPTFLSKELADTVLELIAAAWNPYAPIRMLSVTATNLTDAAGETEQLSLFSPPPNGHTREKQEKLERTMDGIRAKYGSDAIGSAGVLGNDLGIGDPGWGKKDV